MQFAIKMTHDPRISDIPNTTSQFSLLQRYEQMCLWIALSKKSKYCKWNHMQQFFSMLVIFPLHCFNLLDFPPLYTSTAEVLTSLSGWRNFLKSLGLDFCTFLLDIELGFPFETVGLLWCIHKNFNFLLEALCAFQILA